MAAEACLAGGISFTVKPSVIEMGAFYSGVNMRIEGAVAKDSQVLITVVGWRADESFHEKRRIGPLWLNSGKVRICGVPSVFLRFTSAPIRTLLAPDEIEHDLLDERSLLRQTRIELDRSGDDQAIRADYVSLKTDQGCYRFGNAGVVMRRSDPAGTHFSLDFPWPRKARSGSFEVRVYEVRDGSIVGMQSQTIRAVRVGLPAWLAALANQKASLYGLAAVLISAFSGFAIDFIMTRLFGKKRVHAH